MEHGCWERRSHKLGLPWCSYQGGQHLWSQAGRCSSQGLGKPWGFKSQTVFLQACLSLWGHLCSAHGGRGGPRLPAEPSRHACLWAEQRWSRTWQFSPGGEQRLEVILGPATPVGLSCGQWIGPSLAIGVLHPIHSLSICPSILPASPFSHVYLDSFVQLCPPPPCSSGTPNAHLPPGLCLCCPRHLECPHCKCCIVCLPCHIQSAHRKLKPNPLFSFLSACFTLLHSSYHWVYFTCIGLLINYLSPPPALRGQRFLCSVHCGIPSI